MSGYVRLPTSDDSQKHRDESDVEDESRSDTSGHEDCASFADNEDNQGSPLIGSLNSKVILGGGVQN